MSPEEKTPLSWPLWSTPWYEPWGQGPPHRRIPESALFIPYRYKYIYYVLDIE